MSNTKIFNERIPLCEAQKMADGKMIKGIAIGSDMFSYVITEEDLREAMYSGENNDVIKIPATRVLTSSIIQNQPLTNIQKVVRCKDCVFWQGKKGINLGSRCLRNQSEKENSIPVWCNENDFCSFGKKDEG